MHSTIYHKRKAEVHQKIFENLNIDPSTIKRTRDKNTNELLVLEAISNAIEIVVESAIQNVTAENHGIDHQYFLDILKDEVGKQTFAKIEKLFPEQPTETE